VTASDLDVVRSVRRGDRDAFGHLVRAYQGRLFGLVLMMVREPAGAEEVTQDAFVRAYTHLGQYDDRRPFYPWIAAIAVRLAQNWLRQHGRSVHREGTALESVDEPGATAPASLSVLIDDEGKRTLWRAVAALPSGERTAVILYYRGRDGGERHRTRARRDHRNDQDISLSRQAPSSRAPEDRFRNVVD
jgi:RNA polymerase sigma-70 factor (ECF subfamily)